MGQGNLPPPQYCRGNVGVDVNYSHSLGILQMLAKPVKDRPAYQLYRTIGDPVVFSCHSIYIIKTACQQIGQLFKPVSPSVKTDPL